MLLWDFEVARRLFREESLLDRVGYKKPKDKNDLLPIGVAIALISDWILRDTDQDQEMNLLTFLQKGDYQIFVGNESKRWNAIKKILKESKTEFDTYEQVSIFSELNVCNFLLQQI